MYRQFIKNCLLKRNSINLNTKRPAGHSKWQNIRHIKTAKDQQRSQLFTRLSRQMKIAVQEGGSANPKNNVQLEQIIEQCKRANMPNATVQSVLKSCENDKSNSRSHLFEIKGPGSCIILCEVFTSNLHQLKQNIASVLRKHNCKFSDGGAKHLFDEKGIIDIEIADKTKSMDELLELATEHAIEAGAEEVEIFNDTTLRFICGSTNLRQVVGNLEMNQKYKITSASIEFIPLKVQELTDSDLQLCSSLYDKLENLPEVVRISDNIA